MSARTLIALAFTALLLPLAGCAQKQADQPTADSAKTQTEGKVAYVADTLSNATVTTAAFAKDTVLLLKAGAGPSGNLTSFLYTIPAGAINDEAFPGQSSVRIKHFDMEFVPVDGQNATSLQEYAVLGFKLGKEADLRFSYVDTHMTGTSHQAVIATPTEHEVSLRSFTVSIGASDLKAGDRLAFVLAARATSNRSLSYLAQATNRSYFDFSGPPSSAPEDLLRNRTAVRVDSYATGSGFQYAYYENSNGLGSGDEVKTDSATVTDVLPRTDPLVTARDVTLEAKRSAPGFTVANGLYLGLDSHGLWSVTADAHGTQLSGRSIVAFDALTPAVLPEVLLFGIPIYSLQGDGGGDASTSMHLQVTDVNTLVDVLAFEQLDLGASLKDLTGRVAATGGFVFNGLAGNVPPSTPATFPTMLAIHGDRLWQMDQDGRLSSMPFAPHPQHA